MIYKELTLSQFRDEFHRAGRGEQFSYDGLTALYELLEEMGHDCELDVIALCCEFVESDWDEAMDDYDMSKDEIRNNTMVLELNEDRIIYSAF